MHAASAPPGQALADLSLEQLMDLKIERVYGASRHEQKVTHAPSAVSIVTAEEIRQFGWRTLGDLLRSVRGLYVADDRNYSYLGVRGFQRPGDYNTRILVLVDGHRMNDNVYHSAYMGRDAIAPELIERVEVIRGPSSSIYGSNAFFGVINIVTKSAAQIGDGEASFAAGNFGTYEGQLSLARTLKNGVAWSVTGSYFTTDGERNLYFPEFDPRRSTNPLAANNGVAENLDAERAGQVFAKVTYRSLTFSASGSRRAKDVPTASFGTLFNYQNPAEQTTDRRAYFDAKLDQTIGDGEARVMGRVFYDSYRYTGNYPFDYGTAGAPQIVDFSDGADGSWAGTEWQVNVPLSARHRWIGGLEYRHSFHADQFAEDTVSPMFKHVQTDEGAVFGQWEVMLRDNLRLTAGGRYDYYFESFGGTFNPRFAAIYNPDEASAVKLLHGRAFRAPNPYENHYFDAQAFQPALRPERIVTSEIVFERYFGSAYRVNLSGYEYQVEHLISQGGGASELYFTNAEETKTRGVEAEIEARQSGGWMTRAGYAWQRTRDRLTRAELSSSPRGLGKLNIGWTPRQGKFSAGIEVQYQSGTRTLSGGRVEAFVIANAHLSTTAIVPGCELAVSAFNFTDRRYAYPGAGDHAQEEIPQLGRTFRVKLTKRF